MDGYNIEELDVNVHMNIDIDREKQYKIKRKGRNERKKERKKERKRGMKEESDKYTFDGKYQQFPSATVEKIHTYIQIQEYSYMYPTHLTPPHQRPANPLARS